MAERPLSPHLQVYRPQLTSVLSITHRATGVVLALGTVVVVWWLYAVAAGPGAFADAQGFMGSWFGKLVLLGLAFCTFYHLFNGIRHLLWDMGYALELKPAYQTGWTVLALTVICFAISCWFILGGGA